MADIPYPLAVAAGTLAALNPCGFALLPVYLSVLAAGGGATDRRDAVVRALASAGAITAGFVVVFGAFGALVTSVGGVIQRELPWVTVVLGLGLVGAGVWLLAGRELPGVSGWAMRAPTLTRTVPVMMTFGAAYALVSLGCTVGPFLAIVVTSFRSGSVAAGTALFLSYAAGMGLVVGACAVLTALARDTAIARLRRLAPLVSRAGGAVALLAGAYVAYYGWYEIRLYDGGDVEDPVVAAAGRVQRWLAGGVDQLGAAGVAIIFAAAAVGGGLLLRRRARRSVEESADRLDDQGVIVGLGQAGDGDRADDPDGADPHGK
jgi:cytochrome c biogenesis protein CcdA